MVLLLSWVGLMLGSGGWLVYMAFREGQIRKPEPMRVAVPPPEPAPAASRRVEQTETQPRRYSVRVAAARRPGLVERARPRAAVGDEPAAARRRELGAAE